MEQNFLMILTGTAMLLGILFCVPPISIYIKQKPVKTFGLVLFGSGFLLITSFKWTEMAIKIGNYEVKIANAEQTINELTEQNIQYYAALSTANSKLNSANQNLSHALLNSEETTEKWMQRLADKITTRTRLAEIAGNPPSQNDYISIFKESLETQGLTLVSDVSVSETVNEIDAWRKNWSELSEKFGAIYYSNEGPTPD